MDNWTFEIQWPAPFDQKWQRSGQILETVEKAAEELGKFLAVAAQNDTIMTGRLVKL